MKNTTQAEKLSVAAWYENPKTQREKWERIPQPKAGAPTLGVRGKKRSLNYRQDLK